MLLDAPLERKEHLKRIDITAVRSIEEIEKIVSEGPTIIQLPRLEGTRTLRKQRKVAERPDTAY